MKHQSAIINNLIRAIQIRANIEQCQRNLRRLNKEFETSLVKIREADTLPKITANFENMLREVSIVHDNYKKIISQ